MYAFENCGSRNPGSGLISGAVRDEESIGHKGN